MKRINVVMVLFAMFSGTPGVWADQIPEHDALFMDEVVVTATRFERETQKVPAKVTIIDRQDIEKSGAHSVPDVLRSLGGIQVKDMSGNRINQTLDMGGFGEGSQHRVAVLVNGRRINPIDLSNVRWSTISLNMVDRIEIMHGGNAVLYGDNAMGGVINIITRRPEKGVHGDVEAKAGSFDTLGTRASAGMVRDNLGLILGADYFKSHGYRDRSAVDSLGFFSRVESDFTQNTRAHLEVDANYAYYELPGPLTRAQMQDDPRQAVNRDDDAKDQGIALSLGLESFLTQYGLFDAQVSYHHQDSENNMQSFFSFVDYDVQTWGFTPKYLLDRPLGKMDNRLTMGLDLYRTDYQASVKGWMANDLDHSKRTLSGYLQNELEIVDSLVLNLGARYQDTRYTLQGKGVNFLGQPFRESKKISDSEWAWNAGLAYSFQKNSKVFARAYQAFRYPLVDEYIRLADGKIFTDLKHETQQGYEAGVRWDISGKLLVELRGFMFKVDDEIVWSGDFMTGRNRNLRETEHKGADLDLSYKVLEQVKFFGSAGYTRARIISGEYKNKTIPMVPKWKAHAGIELGRFSGLLFRLQNNYVGKKYYGDDFSNTRQKMSAFSTWDAYLSYEYKRIELFAHAMNIFGEKYSDYGYVMEDWMTGQNVFSYYPQPKQEYMIGVRCRF
jgi:iron complex outermembrane recepter protein